MKLFRTLLATLIISISHSYATSFSVLLDTSYQRSALSSAEKVLSSGSGTSILGSSINMISPRHSYVHFSLSSERAAVDLKLRSQRLGETVLTNERARSVLAKLAKMRPGTLEIVRVNGMPIKIQSFFSRETAHEMIVGYFNMISFSRNTARNAQLMKQQTRGISEVPTRTLLSRALAKHKNLLGSLSEIDSGPLNGAACGSLFCSCWGAGDCNNGIAACYTIHGNLGEGDPDPWTCDSYNGGGECVAGSCRLI